MIHLDTSFMFPALTPGSVEDQPLRRWLKDGAPLRMSVVGCAEFLCGPVDEEGVRLAARLIDEPVGLTADDAAMTATLFNLVGRRRGSLVDCMIAAAALRAGAILATTDPQDFRRLEVAGLRIVAADG